MYVDGSLVASCVEIFNSANRKLQCWDLHVGAKIVLLGRQLTLQRASKETVTWLETKAKRFQYDDTMSNCTQWII